MRTETLATAACSISAVIIYQAFVKALKEMRAPVSLHTTTSRQTLEIVVTVVVKDLLSLDTECRTCAYIVATAQRSGDTIVVTLTTLLTLFLSLLTSGCSCSYSHLSFLQSRASPLINSLVKVIFDIVGTAASLIWVLERSVFVVAAAVLRFCLAYRESDHQCK